jgi:hypothetical protein
VYEGDGVTAKTAITLTSPMTTDCDNDVKLSPKRQHSKITLSTGQDEESVVVVPGKRHKQGDTGHMLALDVQCLCQLHPKPINTSV